MAHVVLIKDTHGDLVELEVYCSDYCAKTSANYAGWFGAVGVEFDTSCSRCKEVIPGECGKYED